MKALFISLLLLFLSTLAWGQNPCISNQSFKVVVMGSSTSAGTGSSHPDSAWVGRYRNYLESINASNEVVNLGVGGYNTYRIMPTGFAPPVGRPNPDPTKNITAALAENPDAIIINMPSNDVAAGFTYSEQMFNLDTIVSIADANNVPIWVCTTQPRNFGNQAQLDLQWEIKDSIYAYFNPRTIDFWTTIALPNYTIDPFYDSGDGVHLNDFGHAVLADRVIQTSILDSIYIAPDTVDYAISDINATPSVCGDSLTEIQIVVTNVGLDNIDQTDVLLQTVNTTFATSELDQFQYPTGLPSCTSDTILFTVNTYQQGNYILSANLTNSADSISANDTDQLQFTTTGHPDPYILNDTLCDPGMALLYTLTSIDDHVFWYDDPLAATPIHDDELLTLPFVNTTQYYYAQTVRGNLYFSEDLHTSLNSNINFNGTMFDLVASDSIVIDSFDVKIATTGPQNVEVFYKSGSHLGYETNATAWTSLGTTSVNVTDPNDWTSVAIGGLSISQGDTIGIHVRLQDPGGQLSYQSVPSPITRSTPELTMITGSGISPNFGANYYPRDWSGGVYYHFGERPLGDCATDRLEAVVVVSDSELDAGNDTIIDILDTLYATASGGFINYDWSTGSDSSSTIIIASDLGQGIHYIDLMATDSVGCVRYDEFVVAVADLVGLDESTSTVSISPNPTTNYIEIHSQSDYYVEFTNLRGQLLDIPEVGVHRYSFANLPDGVYLVHLRSAGKTTVQKIVKSE